MLSFPDIDLREVLFFIYTGIRGGKEGRKGMVGVDVGDDRGMDG
jgi:hypothetical protein